MWVGLAAGEPSPQRRRSSSRTRAGDAAQPLSPRAGMGPAPTLREQMSAAAAAADETPSVDAAATDPELVSLALRVRQHSGSPYDARAPRAPQPPQQAGGPPAWCDRATPCHACQLPTPASRPPCAPPALRSAALTQRVRRRPGAFLGAAAAIAMALRLKGKASPGGSLASSLRGDGSEAGTPRSDSCASLDELLENAAAGRPPAAAAAAAPRPTLPPLPPRRGLTITAPRTQLPPQVRTLRPCRRRENAPSRP
jgi:hypothetical protein